MNWFSVVLIIVSLWFGYGVGWQEAHITVSKECEKLESFYVGNKVFTCSYVKVEENKE